MQEKINKKKSLSVSIFWVSLVLGAVFWIIDSILTVITSTDSSFFPTLIGIDTRGFW